MIWLNMKFNENDHRDVHNNLNISQIGPWHCFRVTTGFMNVTFSQLIIIILSRELQIHVYI